MRQYKNPAVPPEIQLKIIESWRFEKDNRTSIIALKYKVDRSQVNTIINKYLLQKPFIK